MPTTALATRSEETSIFASSDKFEMAGRMATALAKSTIVPKEYQGNASNALIAIELANRMGVSPLMVMQNLYVVYGRPSWSAQYVISAINGSGKYDFELQFDEKTDKSGKPFSCQCWTERNGRKVTGPVIDMDMAKAEGWLGKNGSKWQTMPQMMLRYRAASFFGRMNCPELIMGIYTKEEVIEIGPDSYEEVPYTPTSQVEQEVKEDIAANANSVAFDETVVDPEPAPVKDVEAVIPKPEPAAEAPKSSKGRPKKSEQKPEPMPAPEPEQAVMDLPPADDDGPEWE